MKTLNEYEQQISALKPYTVYRKDFLIQMLREIFDEIERRDIQEIRKELGCERNRQCCSRCLEALKPDRVPTGDLCGLCDDDVRNGR